MFHSNKQVLTKLDSDGSGLFLGAEFISAVFIRTSFKIWVLFVGFFTAILSVQPANAQTFDQASTFALQRICRSGINSPDGTADPLGSVGAKLTKICEDIANGNAGEAAASGVGTQSQPSSILISQQQMKDAQINQEKKEVPSGSGDTVATRWGDRFSTFLTAGATTLRH
ncbi:MAG: hypothetical protein LUQ57_01715, partial [Methylococcaceae bacterium]|nr:hypothetical protein [Methylococcaceae bacterium]